MKEIVLQEVPPPYDTEDVNCDENNPNVYNVELWNEWFRSIDYFSIDYSCDLVSSENKVAIEGHRGVRISEIGQSSYNWYYRIKMGYKIKTEA